MEPSVDLIAAYVDQTPEEDPGRKPSVTRAGDTWIGVGRIGQYNRAVTQRIRRASRAPPGPTPLGDRCSPGGGSGG